jgi:hypothetical protein
VDEQRDGWTSRARQGVQFYARCAGEAWRRSWDAANAWPPIAALLVLLGGARLAGVDLRFDLGFAGDGYGMAIGTGLFVVAAWLAVFLVQLVAAPPRRYARLEAERRAPARPAAAEPPPQLAPPAVPLALPAPAAAPVLQPLTPPSRIGYYRASRESGDAPPPPMTGEDLLAAPHPALSVATRQPDPLQVRLVDQVSETDAVDTAGERLPPSRAYVARVSNRGETRLRRCQLFFGSPTHIQVVSGPFDLAPGAHRDLPVLRVIDESDEPHALLYFLDGETWEVAQGQAAWLPEPGRFKVKVLSANAPAASLDVTLAASEGTPLAWTLVEAADVGTTEAEKAPKAARKRRAWAVEVAADVAAEPGAAD